MYIFVLNFSKILLVSFHILYEIPTLIDKTDIQ